LISVGFNIEKILEPKPTEGDYLIPLEVGKRIPSTIICKVLKV